MFIRWIVKSSLSADESHVIVGGTAFNTPSDHISLSCKGCCLWMAESHAWHIYCDAPHWWHLILGLWSPHLKQAYIWSDNSLLITLRMFSYTILTWWSAYCISGLGRVYITTSSKSPHVNARQFSSRSSIRLCHWLSTVEVEASISCSNLSSSLWAVVESECTDIEHEFCCTQWCSTAGYSKTHALSANLAFITFHQALSSRVFLSVEEPIKRCHRVLRINFTSGFDPSPRKRSVNKNHELPGWCMIFQHF